MSASQIAFWIITGIFLPLGLYLIFSRSDRDWLWGPILTVIGIVALVFAIRGLLREESPKPDVTLRFVYPKSPALLIVNPSLVVARNIRYQVTLFNLDTLTEHDIPPNQPLPIPTQSIDWVGPNAAVGPQNVFFTPLVEPLL